MSAQVSIGAVSEGVGLFGLILETGLLFSSMFINNTKTRSRIMSRREYHAETERTSGG